MTEIENMDPCKIRSVDNFTEEEKTEFDKRCEMMRTIMQKAGRDFYNSILKKLGKLSRKHGDKLWMAPQHFWQEVGGVLADYLMISFVLPRNSTAITSTRKGHLILAEYLAFGVVWSCYCAGTNIDEFFDSIKEKIGKDGAEGRQLFAKWFEENTLCECCRGR
jgi:hypothetical protein